MPKQTAARLSVTYGEMNGFTPDAGRVREQFMREGRAYLAAAARLLTQHGIALVSINRLTAGMGAAGGVTATFRAPTGLLTVDVATSKVEGHSARTDHVVIAAVFTSAEGQRGETGYLDASLDSAQIAQQIVAIVRGE